MKKFKGYQLLKLVRAVGSVDDPENSFSYEVIHHNVFGESQAKTMKVQDVDRDFGKLRMTGDRYAVLEGGIARKISQAEYLEYGGQL